MFNRSTSIITAAGLSAVLLGAAPAGAGPAQGIDEGEKAVARTATTGTLIVSARMAEHGYEVRKTAPRTATPATHMTPIVSARMAEHGYEVRKTTPRTATTVAPIVSPRMAERADEVR